MPVDVTLGVTLHRSVSAVALTAGLCVVGAYLLGSVPIGYLLHRRELRRDLRRLDSRSGTGPEAELRALLAGSGAASRSEPAARGTGGSGTGRGQGLPRALDLAGAALDTAKVVLLAAAATLLVRHVSPGYHPGEVPPASAVGFLSDQVLTSWQSAGLWAGLAAAVGHLCPVYLGFQGGQGQAPTLGLSIRYLPFGFSIAVAGFFLGLAITRDVRRAVLVSLPAFVAYAWVAWVWDLRPSWGAPSGPELALWAAVLAGVVGARTLSRPIIPPPGGGAGGVGLQG